MKNNLLAVFIIPILTGLFFSSCGNSPKSFRYDVSNFVTYLETPPEYGPGQVLSRTPEFKSLEKKNMQNLVKLISKDGNFLWLKIQFTLPDELKDMQFYIPNINSNYEKALAQNYNMLKKYLRTNKIRILNK